MARQRSKKHRTSSSTQSSGGMGLTVADAARSPDRMLVAIMASAVVACLLIMARPLLTGQVPTTGDLLHFHYPIREFYARALADGRAFDWMPGLFDGYYLTGEGQLGAYHPLHWLLYRWLPLDTAFALETVLAYPFMLAGTWLFLRPWCGEAPALFGAVLFTFCGFNLSHGDHINLVAVVSHLPWLLWVVQTVFTAATRTGRWSSLAAIALLTGSQLLLGHPQAVWFSLLVEAAFVMFLWFSPRARWWPPLWIALAKLLGLAIGAVQLLATLNAVRDSTRLGPDESFAFSYSLTPRHLIQLLEPSLLWGRVIGWTAVSGDEYAAYGGAVPLVLLAWWLAARPRLRRLGLISLTDRLGLAALAWGVLGLWLATGRFGGLYYVQTWLPLVRDFRCPARYVLYTQLALAIISAIALMRLVQLARREAAPLRRELVVAWLMGGASLFTAGAFLWPYRGHLEILVEMWPSIVLGPVMFLAAAGTLTWALSGSRRGLAALVLLAACDHALYGLGGVVAWHKSLPRALLLRDLERANAAPPSAEGRILRGAPSNAPLLLGHRMWDGYAAIIPRRRLDQLSLAALRVAEVEYLPAAVQRLARIPELKSEDGVWYRVPHTLPRFRLVTTSRMSLQPAVDLERIDVEHVALTPRELGLSGGSPGVLEVLCDQPGDIRLRSQVDGRQLLVVSETFHDGWTATVNDQPAPVEIVNGDFLGCVLEAGQHDISLRFQPAHLEVGKAISLACSAVAVGLGLVAVLLIPRQRHARGRSSGG
jgi:hypothetical protein